MAHAILYSSLARDFSMSPLTHSWRDFFRLAIAILIVISYFKVVTTTNMAMAYGIAHAGQIQKSYGRPRPADQFKREKKKQLHIKKC